MTYPSWDPQGEGRAALRAIIADPHLGVGALSNPRTMANILKDFLPDRPREASILIAAAESDVAGALRAYVTQGMDAGIAQQLVSTSFAERTALTPDACRWVTSEIAVALGMPPMPGLAAGDPGHPGQPTATSVAMPAPTTTPKAPVAGAGAPFAGTPPAPGFGGTGHPQGGYGQAPAQPAYPQGQAGASPQAQAGGYPQGQAGASPQAQAGGYPQGQAGGYLQDQPGGYRQDQPGYLQQQGYAQAQPGYPQAQPAGYPQAQPGAYQQQQQPGYPPGQPLYDQAQAQPGYPAVQPGYFPGSQFPAGQPAQASKNRIIAIAAAGLAVVLIAVVIFVLKNGASHTVVGEATGVPDSTLSSIGAGHTYSNAFRTVSGTPLTSQGKPELLYIGATFCPYCAANQWAMIVAMSKFGTFTGLHASRSAPSPEVYPNTATLTFYGASFTSQYFTFVSVENESVTKSLQQPTTPQENALWNRYSSGNYPFADFGNRYVAGSLFDPSVLHNKTLKEIAAALSDPSSPIAQAVDGSANMVIAAICAITDNQPASVCDTATVIAIQRKL